MNAEFASRTTAVGVEVIGMTMRFGGFTALDDVSVRFPAGGFHALLGENGAGKSTLVKCMMGYYRATAGSVLVDDREVALPSPKAAHALGLGMVYQHFTLVGSLTGAENLVISRQHVPGVIKWSEELRALGEFMEAMPFAVPLDRPVDQLAAGEKQKLEILKQLYLGRRFLVLDEPTSVLTPDEADEVLSHVRTLTREERITCLLITHKFREVTAFADTVTVLRRGACVGTGRVEDYSHGDMAALMVGSEIMSTASQRNNDTGEVMLRLRDVRAADRTGRKHIEIAKLDVRCGEIVGIAGVSGNGQMELMELLTGQRRRRAGDIVLAGHPFSGARGQAQLANARYLPEEPLRNACAPRMSVAENLAFRAFDLKPDGRRRYWLNRKQMNASAVGAIDSFGVKTTSIHIPIAALSGGNVQRAVLARELSGQVKLLVVSNPCFGLDFAAVSEVRKRILTARNDGAAVLLMSEDLDEILELADRVLVMHAGRITFETPIERADLAEIGHHMAGQG